MLTKFPQLTQLFVFPSCINCGSFYLSKKLLCEFCEKQFIHIQPNNIEKRSLESLDVYYLYLWTNDRLKLNKKIIYSLKSKYSLNYWSTYCESWNQFNSKWPSTTLLIPVPSTNQNRFHTKHMSQVLSRLWQKPILDCLSKKTLTVEQKQQSTRMDRQKIEFTADPIINTWVSDKQITQIVILDDIVTSGATLNAVYMALTDRLKDKNILISAVCLFSRE